jgi:hypothetical protein
VVVVEFSEAGRRACMEDTHCRIDATYTEWRTSITAESKVHEESIKDWPHNLTVGGREVWQAVGDA